MRYISSLERIYCGGSIRPFLYDCSGDRNSSIAKASVISVVSIYQAVSRAYVWFFAEELKTKYTKADLMGMETPVYDEGKRAKDKQLLDEGWLAAKVEAKDVREEDAFTIFAEALFDILAREASSHPTNYVRALGYKSGISFHQRTPHQTSVLYFRPSILRCSLRRVFVVMNRLLR
jgi:hypothetical protein